MEKKKYAYDLSSYRYTDEFSNIDSETSYKSSAFNEFLAEGESLVNAKQANLDAQLFTIYAKDEEEGQIFEQQDHYIGSVINNTLLESFYLAATSYLYSQLEYLLFEIAKITGKLFNSQIRIEEFKTKCKRDNKGISKSLEFIQISSKISIKDLESDWAEIKKFQMIRNCIVHANGIIKSNYIGLDIYAIQKTGLRLERSSNQVKIRKEYLFEMGKICFNFLDRIMEKVWEKHQESNQI